MKYKKKSLYNKYNNLTYVDKRDKWIFTTDLTLTVEKIDVKITVFANKWSSNGRVWGNQNKKMGTNNTSDGGLS